MNINDVKEEKKIDVDILDEEENIDDAVVFNWYKFLFIITKQS